MACLLHVGDAHVQYSAEHSLRLVQPREHGVPVAQPGKLKRRQQCQGRKVQSPRSSQTDNLIHAICSILNSFVHHGIWFVYHREMWVKKKKSNEFNPYCCLGLPHRAALITVRGIENQSLPCSFANTLPLRNCVTQVDALGEAYCCIGCYRLHQDSFISAVYLYSISAVYLYSVSAFVFNFRSIFVVNFSRIFVFNFIFVLNDFSSTFL